MNSSSTILWVSAPAGHADSSLDDAQLMRGLLQGAHVEIFTGALLLSVLALVFGKSMPDGPGMLLCGIPAAAIGLFAGTLRGVLRQSRSTS